MRFTPKTEDELQREQLAEPGCYPFTILKAEDAKSKKGQDMFKLHVTVHHKDGYEYMIFDYVSPHFMAHRFRHLWYAVGKGQAYESGDVRADALEGATGYCDLEIQDAKGDYPAKNVIKDYKLKPAPATEAPKLAPNTTYDDQMPF